MKRIMVFVQLMLAVTLGAKAQYSDYYYHRIGDTIEWKSEIGYYSWWEWKTFYENNLKIKISESGPYEYGCMDVTNFFSLAESTIFLQRFYTPVPLKIIGIAGVSFRGMYTSTSIIPMEDGYQEYFQIYDAMGDSFPLVAQVAWNPLDTMRMLHLSVKYTGYDGCCSYGGRSYYLPLKEYYFDSAVYVTDSFYVGGTLFGNKKNTNVWNRCHTYLYTGGLDYTPSGQPPCDQGGYQGYGCMPTGVSYKIKGYYGPSDLWYFNNNISSDVPACGPFYSSPWRWFPSPQAAPLMIYPIVEVDTTVPPAWACPPVSNIAVTAGGSAATVTWDDFPNYSQVLLRYGKRNQPQGQWTEVDVTGSTLYTLTGLEPQMYYGLSMKAMCDTCKKETPWSELLYFYSGVDTTSGIEGGETLLSRMTFLQPNPARDEVLVTSSFNLLSVDIWTVDGVMVHHQAVSGHDVTVDVSWLRSGTYIVAIHTHAGTTHKRLLIVR